ncbi:MAG: Superoxide dismutase-like protein YojM [Chlamydiae bacterium]|nr:Superoxide dismutase-like protein YojM [Chlamydiota bacterium]
MIQSTHLKAISLLAVIGLAVFGCQSADDKETSQEESQAAEEMTTESSSGHKAFAVVNPKEGSDVVGAVTFTEVEGRVRIIADIGGLTPGKHGFHIHEHGDCSAADASSAGGHFNPTNQKHGGPDSYERHVGDLGNLEADEFGFAHYDRIDRVISLRGEHSIIGKSVIVHEGEDDLMTNPTGNAGKRVACGKIVKSEVK